MAVTDDADERDHTRDETDHDEREEIATAVDAVLDEPGDVQDGDGDADTWKEIGQQAVGQLLWSEFADLKDRQLRLEDALQLTGSEPLTADDVRKWRAELHGLEHLVETMVVPTVDGVEPWERACDHVPYGAIGAAATPDDEPGDD